MITGDINSGLNNDGCKETELPLYGAFDPAVNVRFTSSEQLPAVTVINFKPDIIAAI